MPNCEVCGVAEGLEHKEYCGMTQKEIDRREKSSIPSAPAVVFSLHLNLDGTKENFNQLQLQYHVPLDMSKEEMDEYLDKIFRVVDRRKDYYRLDQLKKSLSEAEVMVFNAEQDLIRIHNQKQEAHISAGGRGRYKANGKDSQQIMLAKNNKENTQAFMDRIKIQIKATEDRLGLTVSTDR